MKEGIQAGACALALAFALGAGSVRAQPDNDVLDLPGREFGPHARGLSRGAQKNTTVHTRPRAELEQMGIRAGAFLILPTLEATRGYNDNVFARDSGEEGDWYQDYEPRLRVRSDWTRHALQAIAHARIRRFDCCDEENYEDWDVRGEGRLDLGRASEVLGSIGYEDRHEDRAAPEDAGLDERTRYKVTSTRLGVNHPRGNWRFGASAQVSDYDFEETETAPPGFLVGDVRDRQRRRGELRAAYDFRPGYGAFVRGGWTQQRYDERTAAGINRDSDGFDVGGGLELDLTDLLFGEVFVGYRKQDYESNTFDTAQGLALGMDLTWNPTLLTSVHFGANRDVQETIVAGASGYTRTRATVELDHELLRTLILTAGVDSLRRSYADTNRREDLLQFRIGARYLANRHMQLKIHLLHRQQNGQNGGREFDQIIIEPAIVVMY
jgi:hypothetical protein